MSINRDLEQAHKTVGLVSGRMAVALVRKQLKRSEMKAWATDLRAVADRLERM